jgi:hypothetical protein
MGGTKAESMKDPHVTGAKPGGDLSKVKLVY